ncbi:hypothetical protein ABBQ32_009395 [Trebouxia sp. C0010 RCD-2024]
MPCKALRGLLNVAPSGQYRALCAAASITDVYDVAIVGAGLTGAALAAGLGSKKITRGLRVALIDRQEPAAIGPPLLDAPANRVSTLTPASVKFLTDVGAWPEIAPPRSAPFCRMQVWDSAGSGFIQYDAAHLSNATMGHVAENGVIQHALMQRLLPNVDRLWPETVQSLQLPPYSQSQWPGTLQAGSAYASLHLQNGRTISAKLVVGSDGGNSKVRQMAQLRTVSWSYKQRGLVATVATDIPNTSALQVFLPNGPLALLPVRDGFSNIVWSTTAAHAAELEAMTPDSFVQAVNMALSRGPSPSSLLGRFVGRQASAAQFEEPPLITRTVGQPPKSFPLVLCHAGRYVRPRLALIGDAAHTVHPLAGQGVNLGFGDVKALVEAVAYAAETGMDIGDITLLQGHYEGPRQRANVRMIAALDGLKRVFEPQAGLSARLRNVGLGLLNELPFAKDRIMQYAMGQ